MSALEMFDFIDQGKVQGGQTADKLTLIDVQIRLVREVGGSIEHVTWFVDMDILLAFIQQHYLEQAR